MFNITKFYILQSYGSLIYSAVKIFVVLMLYLNTKTRFWHSVAHQRGVEYAKNMTCMCAMTSKKLNQKLKSAAGM